MQLLRYKVNGTIFVYAIKIQLHQNQNAANKVPSYISNFYLLINSRDSFVGNQNKFSMLRLFIIPKLQLETIVIDKLTIS